VIAEEFVATLGAENRVLLDRLAPDDTLKPEVDGALNVLNLLKVALKNEIEATEIAARWLVTTDEVDVKLALARQVGDEAKHYRMIADRLRALGFDARPFNPLAKGYGPLFQYLDGLLSTVERVAAGQFTREAIAIVKHRQFIEFCERVGDRETAVLYRDTIEPDATLKPEVEGPLNVPNLLKVALRNEIEATEIAARWLVTTDDVAVKLALGRQVGDEAKHYRLIADRLGQLGIDAAAIDPLAGGYGPLFKYLDTLLTTVERVAAGQFTREAIAVVKNRQFIEFCEHAGDRETAAMYRDVIEPDERYHHELGRTLLLRLATTPAAQAAASSAARKTLELADELQRKALATAGIHHAPGC